MDLQIIYMVVGLLILGAAAGYSAGLFGVGGGAIIVPALFYTYISLGFEQDIAMRTAIATSAATIIVTSLRSAWSHHQRGAVDWQLVWPRNPLRSWGVWIGVGSLLAALFVSNWLSGDALVLIFGVFIAGIALQFIFGRPDWKIAQQVPGGIAPPLAGTVLGGLCSLMGIGFGSIGVTLMVLCGKRIHRAVGTASALGFFIGVPATIGYIISGYGAPGRPIYSLGYVSIIGFVLISASSYLFAPLGVKTAHSLSQGKLRMVLGIALLLVALNMLRKALLA
ncbi:MAG: sulfite exporter TauE/SafE family protein [Robiginitomaculum sp.]|nr:sulfite exporter TauE/SafE family protein [Robiginitomaculum sp.]